MELHLNTYGTYLHKKGEMFEIKIHEEKKAISPERISSIVISNAATISTDAIQMAMEHNIDIIFLDNFGDPYGRVWYPKLGSTTFIRRKLLDIYNQDTGLEFIKRWVTKKMNNQIQFLQTLISKRPEKQNEFDQDLIAMGEFINKIHEITGKISECSGSIMGYEGNTSRYYFKILSHLLPEKYQFQGRSSRPAQDAFNAFLNYGYGILYSKVERALIIAGLDPYIGLMHSDNYNKKSLVFDFIEPYRIMIEQPVFYLFSRYKIKDEHCTPIKNGISLNQEGKKFFVPNLLEHFDKPVQYNNRNIKCIDRIQMDAHSFANYLIGKKEDF